MDDSKTLKPITAKVWSELGVMQIATLRPAKFGGILFRIGPTYSVSGLSTGQQCEAEPELFSKIEGRKATSLIIAIQASFAPLVAIIFHRTKLPRRIVSSEEVHDRQLLG